MATRKYPVTFIGSNLLPTTFLTNGFTMYNGSSVESTKIKTICQSATAGQNIVTVASSTGIEIGQFVTGVNIPALNSNGEPTRVIGKTGNQITLNANVNKNITNLNIYFFNNQKNIEYILHNMAASGVESVRTSVFWKDFEPNAPTVVGGILNHSINWNNSIFPLENYLKLASEVGIQVMPRLGSPPNWAMDWDYKIDNTNLFSFNDPETKTQLQNKGVKIYATGNSGDSFIIIDDLKRGCLLLPNMVITGTNIQDDTRITSLTRVNDTWKINLNQNITGVVDGYVIGTIANYENNNVINGKSKSISNGDVFTFDSVNDAVIFATNLQRRGGSIPSNYNDFANFMNKMLIRFGTNGSFWSGLNNDVTTVTSASSSVISTSYNQTINLIIDSSYPTTSNIVVGMTIESDAYGSVPSTAQNGNDSYIPPNAKICSINGNQITIDKPLNKTMPAGVPVKLIFPKMINYQIWNECDSAAYGKRNYPADFKFRINDGPTHTMDQELLVRGANWPFHPKQIKLKTTDGIFNKSVSVKDYAYEFAYSFIDFIKIIKKEMHDVDPNANAVSNAVTIPKTTYPKIFAIKNGKYAYDKFGVNIYPSDYNGAKASTVLIRQFTDDPNYQTIFQQDKNGYGIPTVNNLTCPNLILSEYGWSTDQIGYGDGAVSETEQNTYIDRLLSWDSSITSFKNLLELPNWQIENVMYFNWVSDETAYVIRSASSNPDAGTNNERGLYRSKNGALKSGTFTVNKGDTFATFTTPVPSLWATGTKIYRLYGSSKSILKNFPNGIEISSENDAISDDRKTVKFKMPYFTTENILIASASVSGDTVTYTTRSAHELITGQRVIISGITGDTKYNTLYTTSVTNASSNGTKLTYFASNKFVVGQTVTITGMLPTGYNITGTVATRTDSQFTIEKTVTLANSTQSGQAKSTDLPITVTGNSKTKTFTIPVSEFGLNPPTGVVNENTGTITKVMNYTFPYLVLNDKNNPATFENLSLSLSSGSDTSNGVGQRILYSKLQLEEFVSIIDIKQSSNYKQLTFTTANDHNIRGKSGQFDSVTIIGITGTNANKYNGSFQIQSLPLSNTFIINAYSVSNLNNEINNLNLTNAKIVISIQPKFAAQTYQDKALYYQGRI